MSMQCDECGLYYSLQDQLENHGCSHPYAEEIVDDSRKFCINCTKEEVHAKEFCRSCYEAKLRQENPAYAERQKQNVKEWHAKNKERVALYNKERNAIRGKDPSYKQAKRIAAFLRTYKLTLDELNEMLSRDCEICGGNQNLRIDHDHVSGKVRGRLCHACNLHLGWFEKETWRKSALAYLEKYKNEALTYDTGKSPPMYTIGEGRYHIQMPAGCELQKNEDGSVTVVKKS